MFHSFIHFYSVYIFDLFVRPYPFTTFFRLFLLDFVTVLAFYRSGIVNLIEINVKKTTPTHHWDTRSTYIYNIHNRNGTHNESISHCFYGSSFNFESNIDIFSSFVCICGCFLLPFQKRKYWHRSFYLFIKFFLLCCLRLVNAVAFLFFASSNRFCCIDRPFRLWSGYLPLLLLSFSLRRLLHI